MAKRRQEVSPQGCWCGSGSNKDQCCAPLLSGDEVATTAEALMRSRYSAYVNQNADYLLATWHQDTRPEVLQLNQYQRWLGLKVYAVVQGQGTDHSGTVEFVARYKIDGKGYRLYEISQFTRQQGRWYYVCGEVGADAG